jgi:hypothetical protein
MLAVRRPSDRVFCQGTMQQMLDQAKPATASEEHGEEPSTVVLISIHLVEAI